MGIVTKRAAGVVLGLALTACWSSSALGFYPYVYYRSWYRPQVIVYPAYYPLYGGYGPGFGQAVSGGDPYGGYLQGAATVIDAQGQYLVKTQQAYLLKEKVRQAQIDNRRRAFDEWLYERAHTPTLNEQREREQKDEVRRDLNDPPATEVWSGRVLNVILVDLQELEGRGVQGPAIPLDADLLAKINVYPAKGPGNVGLLKDRALTWPIGLRILPPALETRPLRDKLDKLLAEAKEQAVKGRVKADLLADLRDTLARLRKYFGKRAEDMPFAQYVESKRFLADLDTAVQALEQGDAGDYLTGKYVAKGRTVRELVKYLTDNGLRFGPAASGDEAAYNALYQAMAVYGREVIAKVAER